MALETSYCWQDQKHWHLQVMLPSARDGDSSSSSVAKFFTQGRACECLWAGPACVQREVAKGFNATGRGKCSERWIPDGSFPEASQDHRQDLGWQQGQERGRLQSS